MTTFNKMHRPELRSWVTSANVAGSDFPNQNPPFAVFRALPPANGAAGNIGQTYDTLRRTSASTACDTRPERRPKPNNLCSTRQRIYRGHNTKPSLLINLALYKLN